MMGRAWLKEGVKGVKVRFHRKNMLDDGKTGICLSLKWGVLGRRHLVRAPACSFVQTGQFAHLRVVVVGSAIRKLQRWLRADRQSVDQRSDSFRAHHGFNTLPS